MTDINWKLHQSIKDKWQREAFDEITDEEIEYLKLLKKDMYKLFPELSDKFKDNILKFLIKKSGKMEERI